MNSQSKHRIKIKTLENNSLSKQPFKKASVATLVSKDKDFRLKKFRRDSKGDDLLIMGYVYQEESILINIYAPNQGNAKYLKQLLIDFKDNISSNTIRVGDFNAALWPLDSPQRQKLNKEILALKEGKRELVDVYRLFIPKDLNIRSSPEHRGHIP